MFIYGCRTREGGLIDYYVSDSDFHKGEFVVVETPNGMAVAKIASGPLEALTSRPDAGLAAIQRLANADEVETYHKNRDLEEQAKEFCKAHIARRKLDMKLVDVEIFFDRSKFIFYFTAPTRIDFRDLVKDLVKEYRARIELRQIGARNEAQMVGAIGNCGQVCCCRRHLRKFAPVTIRMAKEQRLFLNPAKISGVCGRLLCCLSYEQDNYESFHRSSPKPGKRYQTAKGLLKVVRVDMFKNSITVADEDNKETTFSREDWEGLKPWRAAQDMADRNEKDERDDDGYAETGLNAN